MSDLYISITVHADNDRKATFEKTLRRLPAVPSSVNASVNDNELSRRLMELYQEAQDWLAAGKPRRPIQDNPQA